MAEQKVQRGDTSLAVKSGFWYVFSTFITKGLAFITTPIFARLMTKADYGEFANFANWQSMLLIIVSAELYNTLSRAYYDYTEDYDRYASSVTLAGFGITAVFYVFFLLSGKWIYKVVSIPPQYVHLMFFTMFFQSAKQVFLTKERTLYKYKTVAILSILSLVIPTVLSIVLVSNIPEADRLSARMYGFYVPYALVGLYCAVDLLRKGRTFQWNHLKYAFVLALPLLVHYLTTYLLASTNTIITKSVLGAEDAAVVNITTSVMNILTIVFQSVTGAMTTWMMDMLEAGKRPAVRKCFTLFSAGAAIVALGIMILGPEIILIMGGSKYKDALPLIPGLTLSVLIQILSSVFTIILTYDKNVVGTAVSTGLVAVASTVAKVLLLPVYGISVLPIINIIAFLITLIVNYLLIRKAGYRDCANFKVLLLIVAIVAAGMLVCLKLYEMTLVRYIVIGVAFVAAVVIALCTKEKWLPALKKILKKK